MILSRLRRSRHAPSRLAAIVVVVVVSALMVSSSTSAAAASPAARPAAKRPNIVFILTDDLSWNLINEEFAPHIMQLERRGETFDHYFVTDSLCCPSRSTILTGLYPHDTKVATNLPPDGGF